MKFGLVVWHDLLADGASSGLHRVGRLRRNQALRTRPRRRRLPSDHGERNEAAVIDLFSRRVVGLSMSATMAAPGIRDALMIAIRRGGRLDGLLHESDQGRQHTSERFQALLADHDMICSMSRIKLKPTCSTTASGSTTRDDATWPSATSALWTSSKTPRQLKVHVHQIGSSSN